LAVCPAIIYQEFTLISDGQGVFSNPVFRQGIVEGIYRKLFRINRR